MISNGWGLGGGWCRVVEGGGWRVEGGGGWRVVEKGGRWMLV